MSEIELAHLSGAESLNRWNEIEPLYAHAFLGSDLDDYRTRVGGQMRAPGFENVTARHHGWLVGFAYGLPLSKDTGWWGNDLIPTPAPGFADEDGGRTFALIDLAVYAEYRGRGIAKRLVDELLGGRPEERATLATDPDQPDVQAMYERWGWQKVGRKPGHGIETLPYFDLYVISLR